MSHIITYLDIDVEFDDDGEILFMYKDEKQYIEHNLSDNDRAEIRRLIDRHLDQVFVDADLKELNKMDAAYWSSKL